MVGVLVGVSVCVGVAVGVTGVGVKVDVIVGVADGNRTIPGRFEPCSQTTKMAIPMITSRTAPPPTIYGIIFCLRLYPSITLCGDLFPLIVSFFNVGGMLTKNLPEQASMSLRVGRINST